MKTRKLKVTVVVIAAVILAFLIGCGLYIHDYYRADDDALAVLEQNNPAVTITNNTNQQIVFAPEEPIAGIIFYPGGKVQYEAYAPLMEALAEKNILCVLVHMPGNLAVFDVNAADGIIENYPSISQWYIGGHSLGGSMAASYAAGHSGEYNGLILLAAYSTSDLTETSLSVLSVYGTEDGVLNRDSYEKYAPNLPADTTELIIQGGCHSYFGSYGTQKGDGIPSITREEQISQTAEAILELVQNNP